MVWLQKAGGGAAGHGRRQRE